MAGHPPLIRTLCLGLKMTWLPEGHCKSSSARVSLDLMLKRCTAWTAVWRLVVCTGAHKLSIQIQCCTNWHLCLYNLASLYRCPVNLLTGTMSWTSRSVMNHQRQCWYQKWLWSLWNLSIVVTAWAGHLSIAASGLYKAFCVPPLLNSQAWGLPF